ncbi:hypothetical protein APHAL10511_005007 [Amanita phalloides]|nr:hypothetical protein APHAL10511_005007 [Amanita phalloides]
MSSPVPLVYQLSLDDWESIAFHMSTSEGGAGPPSGLLSLLLVSHHIYASTCVRNNARLYARLFRFKFDCSALRRRLTDRWMTDRCLASELVKRFTAMRRLRDQVFNFDDLWTCYLMMLENDGKNMLHLLQWARLKQLIYALMIARAHAPRQQDMSENDTTIYALAIWLMWMTSSRETFRTEHPEILKQISQVLHPLIAAGYLHPSSYAPDTCFHLPLWGPIDSGNLRCSGPEPPKTHVVHYSHSLTIAYPLATTAATLLWTLQSESLQDGHPLPAALRSLPPNRDIANASGHRGPTFQDIHDFHYTVRIQEACSQRSLGASEEIFNLETSPEGSRQFDEDWSRLVACYDLCLGDVPLRGPVYQPGSLCGRWSGRFMEPHVDAHMSAVLGRRPTHTVPLFQKPLYWTLREHHCLDPDETLSAGIHRSGVYDVLNAWLPRGYTIELVEDAIVVLDSTTEQSARYETFIPGDTVHYSARDKLKQEWIFGANDDKESSEDEVRSASDFNDSYIDQDDAYADHVEHLSSGVADILVTGETGSPGDAWGHYQVIGRVRGWDGFIALLQIPDPTGTMPHLGQWIFKGYVHNRNFVGRWRETSTAVGMVGLEGGFVMTRQEVQ